MFKIASTLLPEMLNIRSGNTVQSRPHT